MTLPRRPGDPLLLDCDDLVESVKVDGRCMLVGFVGGQHCSILYCWKGGRSVGVQWLPRKRFQRQRRGEGGINGETEEHVPFLTIRRVYVWIIYTYIYIARGGVLCAYGVERGQEGPGYQF